MPKISDTILAILAEAATDGPRLKLPRTLDRKTYTEVNKVLEANGGKWNRAQQAHVFGESAEDAIEQALLTGEFRRVKQDLGQFDTPEALADRVVHLADVRARQLIYEPSAGVGNLVAAVIRATGTGVGIFANEIDPKRAEICRTTNYRAFGGGGLGMRDFLTIEPNPVFDRVVMNPPFAKQADIDHVTHALKFLEPGGRLVAIMSASVDFRTNSKTLAFKALLESQRGETYMEPVPAGSFRASGTDVNAVILSVDV